MRIRILSDLHEEFRDRIGELPLPPADCDVTVLAGDIANGVDALEVARRACFDGTTRLLVPGNHEYYDGCVADLRAAWREVNAAGGPVRVLDDEAVVIDGVRFLGATLWSDFRLDGPVAEAVARERSMRLMPDFRVIRAQGSRVLTIDDTVGMHEASRDFIARTLAEPFDGPTVVITHHAPSRRSIHPRFAGSPINPAFVTDLERLMGPAALWIHGHTHDAFDYRIGGTRVLANPTGYRRPLEGPARDEALARGAPPFSFENVDWNPALVVSVPTPATTNP